MAKTIKEPHTAASLRSLAAELHRRARALEETADFLESRKIGRISVVGSIGVRRQKTGAIAVLRLFSDKAWRAAAAVAAVRPPTGGR